MKYRKAVINGKFLSQTVTGVQRYAREIVSELDKLAKPNEIILAVNADAKSIPDLKNIKTVRVGRFVGTPWEQISLPLYVLKNRLLCMSLCNMPPILTPHIVVIHDVSYKVNKSFFSRKFAVWYHLVFRLSIKRIKQIVTVSEFSRNEICAAYRKNFQNVTVTYNGWQHMENIETDKLALKKYGLDEGKYFFAMSSLAPNKNLRWTAEAARNNPGYIFAVSGAINKKVFGDIFDFEIPKNLKFLGYVSDGEAKALMKSCKAFLFPTFYEGFGIPPLEALSVGAKTVVSDASCMREIFGNSVYYIEPKKYDIDLDELLKIPVEAPKGVLEKYNWTKSAKKIYQIIKSNIK